MIRSLLPGPPPLPDEIARLVVTKLVGKAATEAAWSVCWFDGVTKGLGLAVTLFVSANLIVLNAVVLILIFRRRGRRHDA